MIRLISWMVGLSLIVLVGCSHTIPPSQTTPQPPPALGKTPPVLHPLSANGKQAQAPESILPVKLTADLTPVQRAIQQSFPERVTEQGHPLARDYRWRFIREGDPEVQIQDGLVKYRAVYRGEIESTAARACRLDPLYPVIEGTGRLMLREQEQGLLVTMADPRTSIDLKPESDTKCNMFNIPVKDQLKELFKQEALTQQIARSLEDAAYAIPLNLVWERLQEPIPVNQANAQLCLYGKARDFTIGSLKGPANQTTITGFARQTPVALFQTPCRSPGGAQVPAMKVHMDRSAVAAQEGQPYKILLTVPVPYAVLNQQLQERLFHQQMKLPTTFGGTLVIEQVTASNVNGRTLLAVDTSGDVNGTLYYWGTPQLERDGNVIAFPDLQMANETKTALDEVKPGYWQMVDQELKGRLKEAAMLDLSQRLGDMKRALSGQHKSGGLSVDLLMARQEAAQVMSTKDALVTDVLLEGTASATGHLPIRQPSRPASVEETPRQPMPTEAQPARSARVPEDERGDDAPPHR
ncbi:MAG TPA: DUF4403 family protein [Nitrospira sp.]|nr:DUF4403 family protein [Nitrospira sp.]